MCLCDAARQRPTTPASWRRPFFADAVVSASPIPPGGRARHILVRRARYSLVRPAQRIAKASKAPTGPTHSNVCFSPQCVTKGEDENCPSRDVITKPDDALPLFEFVRNFHFVFSLPSLFPKKISLGCASERFKRDLPEAAAADIPAFLARRSEKANALRSLAFWQMRFETRCMCACLPSSFVSSSLFFTHETYKDSMQLADRIRILISLPTIHRHGVDISPEE